MKYCPACSMKSQGAYGCGGSEGAWFSVDFSGFKSANDFKYGLGAFHGDRNYKIKPK